MSEKYYTFYNKVKIPSVGLGTWKLNGNKAYEVIKSAIQLGYRHIDTAAMYDNEEVGAAIKDSGINREYLFITSKLPNSVTTYEETILAFNETLKKLDMEYLDLYLIHWPAPLPIRDNYKERNLNVYKAMEELYKKKKIRAIGVSNFMIHHLEVLLPNIEILPMVNQIEIHPHYYDNKTIEYCRDRNILVEAFSPLARGQIMSDETIKKIALNYNKSIAQICIRWCLQKGVLPLPKSMKTNRLKENINVFDFKIKQKDMDKIDEMTKDNERIISHPDTAKY